MVKLTGFALLAVLLAGGCDKHQAAPAPTAASPAEATAVVVPSSAATITPTATAGGETFGAPEASCGEAPVAEAQCGGGGGCQQWDEAAAEVARRPIPVDARWEQIAVQGMTCAGCERRVIANLGQLEGVLAVEADAELGQVRIAMARGGDLRKAAVDRINSLGYQAR